MGRGIGRRTVVGGCCVVCRAVSWGIGRRTAAGGVVMGVFFLQFVDHFVGGFVEKGATGGFQLFADGFHEAFVDFIAYDALRFGPEETCCEEQFLDVLPFGVN